LAPDRQTGIVVRARAAERGGVFRVRVFFGRADKRPRTDQDKSDPVGIERSSGRVQVTGA